MFSLLAFCHSKTHWSGCFTVWQVYFHCKICSCCHPTVTSPIFFLFKGLSIPKNISVSSAHKYHNMSCDSLRMSCDLWLLSSIMCLFWITWNTTSCECKNPLAIHGHFFKINNFSLSKNFLAATLKVMKMHLLTVLAFFFLTLTS